MPVLESVTERWVVNYAESLGWLAFKLNNPSASGWPDRLFVSPNGVHVYIEFKRQGKVPRKLQRYRIDALKRQNCIVYVCDNSEQGKEMIDGNA